MTQPIISALPRHGRGTLTYFYSTDPQQTTAEMSPSSPVPAGIPSLSPPPTCLLHLCSPPFSGLHHQSLSLPIINKNNSSSKAPSINSPLEWNGGCGHAGPGLLLHPKGVLATSSYPQKPLPMAAAPHQHSGCWSRVPPWHSPPGLPGVSFFYQESVVLASVLQSTFRRVCSPSWAALINLVCEAVSSALVNVRYYPPESLLLNLDKSRGKKKKALQKERL